MSLMPETSMMFPSEKPLKTTCRPVMSAFRQTLTASVNSTSQQGGQPSVTKRRASPSSSQKDDPHKKVSGWMGPCADHVWKEPGPQRLRGPAPTPTPTALFVQASCHPYPEPLISRSSGKEPLRDLSHITFSLLFFLRPDS